MRGCRREPRESGASIVELALIAPVMVLLVMGVLDLGRAYRMNIRLESAAREGAAFAQVYPNDVSCGPNGSIVAQAEAEEPSLRSSPDFAVEVSGQDGADAFVTMTGCDGTIASAGERVRVRVSARYDVTTPIVAQAVGSSIRLSGSAEVRVQGQVRP